MTFYIGYGLTTVWGSGIVEKIKSTTKKHNDRGCVVHQQKAGCVQVQETAFERETRRKDAGTWGCISWAQSEEFYDCHRISMEGYLKRRFFGTACGGSFFVRIPI